MLLQKWRCCAVTINVEVGLEVYCEKLECMYMSRVRYAGKHRDLKTTNCLKIWRSSDIWSLVKSKLHV